MDSTEAYLLIQHHEEIMKQHQMNLFAMNLFIKYFTENPSAPNQAEWEVLIVQNAVISKLDWEKSRDELKEKGLLA